LIWLLSLGWTFTRGAAFPTWSDASSNSVGGFAEHPAEAKTLHRRIAAMRLHLRLFALGVGHAANDNRRQPGKNHCVP